MVADANKLMTKIMTGFRSARSLQSVRKDFHFPAALLSALQPLKPDRPQPSAAALLCGTLQAGKRGAALKDPQRVTDPSTLRRWFRSLDSSQPPFSFLRSAMQAVGVDAQGTEALVLTLRLCWQTLFPCFDRFWPLRL